MLPVSKSRESHHSESSTLFRGYLQISPPFPASTPITLPISAGVEVKYKVLPTVCKGMMCCVNDTCTGQCIRGGIKAAGEVAVRNAFRLL
jgi:hypothetical protein